MSYSDLPADISRNRLLEDLSVQDLLILCQVNQSYANLCSRPSFWSRYLIERFNVVYSGRLARFVALFLDQLKISSELQQQVLQLFDFLESLNIPFGVPTISTVTSPYDPKRFGYRITFPIETEGTFAIEVSNRKFLFAFQIIRVSLVINFGKTSYLFNIPYNDQTLQLLRETLMNLPNSSEEPGVNSLIQYLRLTTITRNRNYVLLSNHVDIIEINQKS